MASRWTDGTAMYDAPTGLDTGFEQIVKESYAQIVWACRALCSRENAKNFCRILFVKLAYAFFSSALKPGCAIRDAG